MSDKLTKFRSIYAKFEDVFSALMIVLCTLIFIVMVFSVSYGVLGRYLKFIKSPRWTQELAILALVWLCFVSAGLAIKENKHVRMTLVTSAVPKKVAVVLDIFAYVILIAVSVFWVYYGLQLCNLSKFAKMSATGWPMNLNYYSLVIGGCYGFFMSLGKLIKGGH